MDKWYSLYLKLQIWLESPSTCFSYRHEGAFRQKVEKHARAIPNYSDIDIMLAVDKIMLDRQNEKHNNKK